MLHLSPTNGGDDPFLDYNLEGGLYESVIQEITVIGYIIQN